MNTARRGTPMKMQMSIRGFSLIECVVALPIMAVFLSMAAQLFHGCLVMVRYSGDQSTRVVQRQMIIRRLRADTQTSRSILLVNRRLLACRTPKGCIEWQITPHGAVERKWRMEPRRKGPMTLWRSDAVMPSAYFKLSARHTLRLYYFVHGGQKVVATTPIDNLLPRSHR